MRKFTGYSHPSLLDLIGQLNEELLVLGSILSANEDFHGKAAPLDLLQVLC